MRSILKKWMTFMKGKSFKEKKIIPSNPNGLYSVRETAEILGITMSRVYHAIYQNKLSYKRTGKIYVLHIDDLRSYEATLREAA